MVVTMINASVRLKRDKVRTIEQKPRWGEWKNVIAATLKCWHCLLDIELSPDYVITLE